MNRSNWEQTVHPEVRLFRGSAKRALERLPALPEITVPPMDAVILPL